MIYEIIIISSIVGIFIILIRRLPNMRGVGNRVNSTFDKDKSINYTLQEGKKEKEKMNPFDSLEKADQLFQDKKYVEAEKLYIEFATQEPNNPKVYNRLGVLYLEQKNFSDAKEAFRQTLEHNDKKAARWYNYSLACVGLQEYRNAIEALEKAMRFDKKNDKYSEMLKEVRSKLKKIASKKK